MKPQKGRNVSRQNNRFPIDTFTLTKMSCEPLTKIQAPDVCQFNKVVGVYLEAVRRKYHPQPDVENIGACDKLQQYQHALHKPVHGRGLNFTSFSQVDFDRTILVQGNRQWLSRTFRP